MGNKTRGMIDSGCSSAFILLPNISEETLKFSNNISKKLMLEDNKQIFSCYKHLQERQKNFDTVSCRRTHRISVEREYKIIFLTLICVALKDL